MCVFGRRRSSAREAAGPLKRFLSLSHRRYKLNCARQTIKRFKNYGRQNFCALIHKRCRLNCARQKPDALNIGGAKNVEL
jgi:hypothetical protein